MRAYGLVFKRSGPDTALVSYWLQHSHSVKITRDLLNTIAKRLVLLCKLSVSKHQEKKVGLKSQM